MVTDEVLLGMRVKGKEVVGEVILLKALMPEATHLSQLIGEGRVVIEVQVVLKEDGKEIGKAARKREDGLETAPLVIAKGTKRVVTDPDLQEEKGLH